MLKYFNKSITAVTQRERHKELSGSLADTERALNAARGRAASARQQHETLINAVAIGSSSREELRAAGEAVTAADAEVSKLTSEVAELQRVAKRAGELVQVASDHEKEAELDEVRAEYIRALQALGDSISEAYLANASVKALRDQIAAKHPTLLGRLPRYSWWPHLACGGFISAWFQVMAAESREVLTEKGKATLAALTEDQRDWDRAQRSQSKPDPNWRNPIEMLEERESRMRWEMLPEKQRARVKLEDVLAQLREDRARRRKGYREEREASFDAQRQEQQRHAS